MPTDPPREVRRSIPSTRCASSTKSAARLGGGDEVGALEQHTGIREGGDRQPVPRRDHLVVAARLGSLRAGGQQPGRASPPTTPGRRGRCRSCRVEAPASKVPVGRDRRAGPRHVRRPRPEHLDELGGCPRVGEALVRVAVDDGVGVERGREPALVGAQVAQQEVGGLLGHPPCERVAGRAPQVGVDAQQQGVVVEHLLEVRHDPVARRRQYRAKPPPSWSYIPPRAIAAQYRGPSRARRPSRCGRGGAGGTPAPSTAGTWGHRRTRRS